jgi:hypothetical protein
VTQVMELSRQGMRCSRESLMARERPSGLLSPQTFDLQSESASSTHDSNSPHGSLTQ